MSGTYINPIDALNELDRAASEVNGTRAFHMHVSHRTKIVRDAIMREMVRDKLASEVQKTEG